MLENLQPTSGPLWSRAVSPGQSVPQDGVWCTQLVSTNIDQVYDAQLLHLLSLGIIKTLKKEHSSHKHCAWFYFYCNIYFRLNRINYKLDDF